MSTSAKHKRETNGAAKRVPGRPRQPTCASCGHGCDNSKFCPNCGVSTDAAAAPIAIETSAAGAAKVDIKHWEAEAGKGFHAYVSPLSHKKLVMICAAYDWSRTNAAEAMIIKFWISNEAEILKLLEEKGIAL